SSPSVTLAANATGFSMLTCTSASSGTFMVTIAGSGSPGTASHQATAQFTFVGDFSISATSPSDFNTGATGSTTVTLTSINNFAGMVTLTTSVTPSSGLSVTGCSPNPASVSAGASTNSVCS